MLEARVVVDDLIYAEGIRWSQGKVWVSDMLDFRVLTYDPQSGRTETVVRTTDRPSGLGFTPDGRLLVATMGQRKLLRLDPGGLTTLADLSAESSLLNDMVTDQKGRSYLDSHVGPPGVDGRLILVKPDGNHREVAAGLKGPNGLAVSADGGTLVVNDLFAHRIEAFDIAADGGLSNRRLFADLGEDSPDGLCLDAEGAAWVGQPFQNRLRRILPGGEVTHEIPCGSKWGVAPVLGGPDRKTLYFCSAEITLEKIQKLMEHPDRARGECRAWIEAVEVDVPGAGLP